jgi:hypothetical protein
MAMEATKRLLKSYQNAAVNLRRVADEIATRDTSEQGMVVSSRSRALIYETVANELKLALTEDKVDLSE